MRTINGVSVRDTLADFVDPKTTAVVVVDVQNDFVHSDGHFARHKKDLSSIQAMLPKLVAFVNAAQDLGVRTVFIQQLTLPHGKSDSPAWLRFKTRDGKSSEYTLKGSWGADFAEGLRPRDADIVIEKFRPDAFIHTNLDQMLRANGIETVLVLGTITEGCVESTIRGASYHDYYVVSVHDLIASPNALLHEGSMRLVQARYPMATSDEILATWQSLKQPADAVA